MIFKRYLDIMEENRRFFSLNLFFWIKLFGVQLDIVPNFKSFAIRSFM